MPGNGLTDAALIDVLASLKPFELTADETKNKAAYGKTRVEGKATIGSYVLWRPFARARVCVSVCVSVCECVCVCVCMRIWVCLSRILYRERGQTW
jgi:hypothetical protein